MQWEDPTRSHDMTESKVFSGPARPNSDKERFILIVDLLLADNFTILHHAGP